MPESHPRYRTILLFGMPGSGKGTQGAVLDKLPFFVHVSMGDVFRKLPKGSKLGSQIVDITSRGSMVPDDLTIEVYSRYINNLEQQDLLTKNDHILILDGIPRNYQQARLLDQKVDVLEIFHLVIRDTKVAKERLRGRALREGRLDDMHEDVINRRFKTYYEETYDTLRFYDRSVIYEVEASTTPLHVLQKIVNRLVSLQPVQEAIGGTLALGVRLPKPDLTPDPSSESTVELPARHLGDLGDSSALGPDSQPAPELEPASASSPSSSSQGSSQ